jgi:hypothetical protein
LDLISSRLVWQVRAALDENLLLPLRHPDVYKEVMSGTRTHHTVAPHAKAILFEGPPGSPTSGAPTLWDSSPHEDAHAES